MKKVRSRARRIPAFGEWNYDHGNGDWPVTQYFDAAMQAGVVVATLPSSPKPVKKAVKWSDSATLEVELEKQQHKAVASFGDPGAKKQGKQSRVADAGAHASANYKACRVARAVDEDLYEIPPDLLCHKPRKRLTRSMWTCCLGLSCIA